MINQLIQISQVQRIEKDSLRIDKRQSNIIQKIFIGLYPEIAQNIFVYKQHEIDKSVKPQSYNPFMKHYKYMYEVLIESMFIQEYICGLEIRGREYKMEMIRNDSHLEEMNKMFSEFTSSKKGMNIEIRTNSQNKRMLVHKSQIEENRMSRFEDNFQMQLNKMGMQFYSHVLVGPFEIDLLVEHKYFIDLQGSPHQLEVYDHSTQSYQTIISTNKSQFKKIACQFLQLRKYIQFNDYKQWDQLDLDQKKKESFILKILDQMDKEFVYKNEEGKKEKKEKKGKKEDIIFKNIQLQTRWDNK